MKSFRLFPDVVKIVLLGIVTSWIGQLSSVANGAPVVIGFERFGRHGEVALSEAGTLLISELNCVACHPSSDPWLSPKGGPLLAGAGNRLQSDWLRAYLASPPSQKPGTTMPHALAGLDPAERSETIDALVAYLTSRRMPFAKLKAGGALPVVHEFWQRGNADRGRELYHTVGCVACHDPDNDYETAAAPPSAIDALIEQLDPEEIAELGLTGVARAVPSIPHADLAAKYTPRSLTMMLLDPRSTLPSARMPSLRLSPAEAADIAAHLLRNQRAGVESTMEESSLELIEQGRSLFVRLRCVNCHETGDPLHALESKPLAQVDPAAKSNCIDNPTNGLPHFELDALQRQAIRAALSRSEFDSSDPNSQVRFRMTQLNCYGCHERSELSAGPSLGGVGRFRKPYFETVGKVDLGDEGRLPPPLTGAGRKLLPKALAAVFDSRTDPRRTYMTIRMPQYHADTVSSLVSQLPKADGADPTSAANVFNAGDGKAATDLASVGRDLVNTGCVECHPFAGNSLPGVIGIELDGVTQRVHPAWFREFLFNPGEVKSRTRMPTFFPDGKSNQPDVLGGDVDKQIAAIWFYLDDIANQGLPEKIDTVRSANYELTPGERPLVLRTFIEGVGTHGIAVGFPNGVHYAFDAEEVRMAIAWKGRFLDARGTWFERFAPPASPLGNQKIEFPNPPTWIRTTTEASAAPTEVPRAFRGYRLEPDGTPTLLYEVDRWQVEDRMEGTRHDRFRRHLTLRPAPSIGEDPHLDDGASDELAWLAHQGKSMRRVGPMAFVDDQGVTVTVSPEIGHVGELQQTEQGTQWIIPLGRVQQKQWVVEYQW